jgi:hypothetical protein
MRPAPSRHLAEREDPRASGERVGQGVVQDDGDHCGLQARRAFDGQIDRPRSLGLDPVAEPAKRPVGREHYAEDLAGRHVEGGEQRGRAVPRIG